MTTKKYTPNTIKQTTGGTYTKFTSINNIKSDKNTFAKSGLIAGKSKKTGNRPSTITVSNFKTNLPTGSVVTKITVKLKHQKVAKDGKVCNIQAPAVSIVDGEKVIDFYKGNPMTKKAKAPTTTATENVINYTTTKSYNIFNTTTFGVRIDYPTNSNEQSGYIQLYYVELTLEYRTASYALNLDHVSGEYNSDVFWFKVKVSNTNLVYYSPSVALTVPVGFNFVGENPVESGSSDVNVEKVNATTLKLVPNFSNKQGTQEILLGFDSNFSFGAGVDYVDRTLTLGVSLTGVTASKTVRVYKDRPVDPTVDPEPEEVPDVPDEQMMPDVPAFLQVEQFYNFKLSPQFTPEEIASSAVWSGGTHDGEHYFIWVLYSNPDFSGNLTRMSSWNIMESDWDSSGNITRAFSIQETGRYTYKIYSGRNSREGTVIRSIDVEVYPRDMAPPAFSIFTPTEEELHRLGSGYNYTVQSYIKETTNDLYIRDWGKNFRIGVFNNPLPENITHITYTDEDGNPDDITYDLTDYDNLTPVEIFTNAEYWSNSLTSMNTFQDVTCEFTYNKDYPLHILITGDYPEATTHATITYTEPCIVETEVYQSREPNGVYPMPIDDIVLNDGSSANLNLSSQSNASPLVFYDLPLEDNYGTNDEIAIRGLELKGTLEQNTDNLILFATLKNSQNESRQRSLILDELDNTQLDNNQFSIGGIGDLWGFSTLDVINLEDWEAHLQISNSLNDDMGTVNFGDVQLIIYVEEIPPSVVRTYIDGQDLSYYGIFLTDLKIPEGLKTDTGYINVNGTDVNDPYRQNIKEKTIEVTFEVGDCDLEGSTNSLREISKLLVNERDKYNRPIPKRLEFSHYPDVFWEYILEDTIDADIDISTYTVKAKLVIPAGTSYDKVPTKTNNTGYINGLVHIRPVVQFKPSGGIVTVTEEISEQEFNISYDGDWTGKIVELDCDNRRAYLKDDDDDIGGEDISNYVDFNADWFTILGEYKFSCIGGAILSVKFQERWS